MRHKKRDHGVVRGHIYARCETRWTLECCVCSCQHQRQPASAVHSLCGEAIADREKKTTVIKQLICFAPDARAIIITAPATGCINHAVPPEQPILVNITALVEHLKTPRHMGKLRILAASHILFTTQLNLPLPLEAETDHYNHCQCVSNTQQVL